MLQFWTVYVLILFIEFYFPSIINPTQYYTDNKERYQNSNCKHTPNYALATKCQNLSLVYPHGTRCPRIFTRHWVHDFLNYCIAPTRKTLSSSVLFIYPACLMLCMWIANIEQWPNQRTVSANIKKITLSGNRRSFSWLESHSKRNLNYWLFFFVV